MNACHRVSTYLYLIFFSAFALGQVWLLRDTVMGDAFIHFVFARGIALGDFFSYNGVFSAGSTSPLWSIMLAPIWSFFGDGIVPGAKIFSSAFVVSSVWLSYFVARRISGVHALSLLASFFVATSFILPFWAAKGMETPFWVSLVLGSFLVYFKILDRQGSVYFEIMLGVLLGLGIFTRPEAWFLAVFLGLPLLIQQKSWRPLFTVGAPAVLIFAPYYVLLFSKTGQIFPSSAARVLHAQQWLSPIFGWYISTEIPKILATKFSMLLPFFLLFLWAYTTNRLAIFAGHLASQIADLARKFQTALGMTHLTDRRFIFWPIFAWLIFHFIFFSTVMPMTQGYRYVLAAMPFFIILSLIGLWQLRVRGSFSMLVILIVGAWLSVSTQQLIERQAVIVTCEVPFINAVRQETGLWLRDNTAPDDLIAMKEVDQSAYYSGRAVLSIDGTLNLAAVPFVRAHDQLGYLNEFRPDWLVLEEEMYNYPGWRGSNLQPLIDPSLVIGDSKELAGIQFQLANKTNVGTQNNCEHFIGEKPADEPYFWYFYKVNYK